MCDQLATAMAELEESTVLKLVQAKLNAGENPMAILASCREGSRQNGHGGLRPGSRHLYAGRISESLKSFIRVPSKLQISAVRVKSCMMFSYVPEVPMINHREGLP